MEVKLTIVRASRYCVDMASSLPRSGEQRKFERL